LPAAKVAVSSALSPENASDTQTIPLVQQQLTTLETGHMFWRGEIWQGQPMEWDIYEHPQDKEKENESDQAATMAYTAPVINAPTWRYYRYYCNQCAGI